MATSRRGLLIGVAGLAALAWGWQRYFVGRQTLNPVPMAGLPGWERIDLAEASLGGGATDAVLLGIGDEGEAVPRLSEAALCEALYAKAGSGPKVAVFSDFFCPFCRRLIPRLASWESPLAITWHELPLLGPASEIAAKAALAAELQGGYAAFQAALLGAGFRPSPAFLSDVAERAGLDGARVLRDMEGPEVAARLLETQRAAETLGIYGTPALTIGKTLVIGEIGEARLRELLLEERRSC